MREDLRERAEQVLSKGQDNNTKQGGLDRKHDGLMTMMMMMMMMMMLAVVVVVVMMMMMMMMMMMALQTLSRLRWYSYMSNESR